MALLIWYSCPNKKYNFVENFQQKPNWIDTIKCLGLDNNDINLFHSYIANIVNGEDPKRFMKDIGLRVGKVKFVTDEGDLEDDMYLLDYERVSKALEDDKS